MPTVILLDTSVSMIRPFACGDNGETVTLLQLAVNGINFFLDHLAVHDKLEFVAVVTFSSSSDVLVNFTRDFDMIRTKLAKIEEGDKANLEIGLSAVVKLVMGEWGSSGSFNVVLFTDDGLCHSYLRSPAFPLPFPFQGKLHILSMWQPLNATVAAYHRIVEMQSSSPSCVLAPEQNPVSSKSITAMVKKLLDTEYVPFVGVLKCGNLISKIGMHPSPEPFKRFVFGETVTSVFSETLEVCGFINISDLGSPMAVSRHLVTPLPAGKSELKDKPEPDEDDFEEGKLPSFCVLFHGALKVENVAALCTLGENWFGLLYSWADNKKKSNLMLAVLEPGENSVPWFGNLNYLGLAEEHSSVVVEPLSFPVRPLEKRSYSQNTVVWIRRAGLQSDIQKVLRHARKLPEKSQQFYKELNRLRKAAINFGFIEMLDGMATILERETTALPPSLPQECSIQLRHAADVLRRPVARDPKYVMVPCKSRYQDND